MADFSYLDQFLDMEIDLTEYLKSIPTTGEKYILSNKQPVVTSVKNLFTKFDVVYNYKNNIDVISKYTINDGDFIETVSHKIYGNVQYWWIIAIFNDIKDPFKDWPLSQQQVINISKFLYDNERKYSYNTYLNFIFEENEKKREIIVPNVDTLKDIIWLYRQAILGK